MIFFLLPVGEILVNSLKVGDGGWGFEHYERLAALPAYARVLGTTFAISLTVAALSIVIAYPMAFLLSHMSVRRRMRWTIWLMVPFWTSYLVKTFAWILLLSRTGALGQLATALSDGTFYLGLIPSLSGVLIGMVHALVPLAVITMLPIMQGISAQLSGAAQTLGAGRSGAFLTVFLPLSLPGVWAAGLLVFITTLGFFIVPALLGTPKETMIAQLIISVILETFNMPFAGALSAVLLIATVLVFIAYDRAVGLSSIGGMESSRSGSSRGASSGLLMRATIRMGALLDRMANRVPNAIGSWSGSVLTGYAALLALLLVLPTLIVVPISITNSAALTFPPQGFSLRWYEAFITSPIWQAALIRSLLVGLSTALIGVTMGLGAALMLTRLNGRVSNAVFSFLVAPLILPRIIVAVGLFYLLGRLGLVGTEAGLVIGHVVLALPYVVVTLAAALKRYDWRLEDAAMILGAGAFTRMRTVMLPLLAPSAAAAFLLAFLTSFDDLTIAIFVSGGLSTTLPKQMWDDMVLQVNPTLAAVSTSLLLLVTAAVFLLSSFRRDR